MDFERAAAAAKEAIELGAKALLDRLALPQGPLAQPHRLRSGLGARPQEAGLPILFHVGGEEKLNPDYFENGLPRVKDFHGGEENFTSVSFMPIPNSVMQTLACLIIDGVMDRFPRLKFGAIELGASWVPSWMRFMDSAAARLLQERGAAAQALGQAQRDRPAAGARHALSARGHRLDHPQLAATR